MNNYQKLWWRQARSDHGVLVFLRRQGAAPCHQLHYLQMVTEKLGKAYFWRSGSPPTGSHAYFAKFMQRLGSARASERRQIADVFAFGPNPEYPWPRTAPKYAPATFEFDVWTKLTGTGPGRQLMQIIDVAVDKFPVYG